MPKQRHPKPDPDREQAIAKAREITGAALDANFEVRPIGERHAIDWSCLQGGKHRGMSIVELAATEEGRSYLFWLCENCAKSSQYAKTVELAKPYLASEYAAKATEDEARAAKAKAMAELLDPVAQALKDGRGGFCDKMAESMMNGQLPSWGAWTTICDILAKACGRRGSKAYTAEYERIEAIYGKASA